jgi:hypothetical protein
VADLVLTRTDKRLYSLEGVGTLRLQKMFWNAATAESGGRSWRFVRRGWFRRKIEATDESGQPVGTFEGNRGWRRGGTVRWEGRDFTLRSRSTWKAQRFVLQQGEHEVAVFEGRGSDKRPVTVSADEPLALDAGLLLLTAFAVRGLVLDAIAAISAAGAAGAGV